MLDVHHSSTEHNEVSTGENQLSVVLLVQQIHSYPQHQWPSRPITEYKSSVNLIINYKLCSNRSIIQPLSRKITHRSKEEAWNILLAYRSECDSKQCTFYSGKYLSRNTVPTSMSQYELMTDSRIVQCLVTWLYQENSPNPSQICTERTFLFLSPTRTGSRTNGAQTTIKSKICDDKISSSVVLLPVLTAVCWWIFSFSGVWSRGDYQTVADVSQDLSTSIFRVSAVPRQGVTSQKTWIFRCYISLSKVSLCVQKCGLFCKYSNAISTVFEPSWCNISVKSCSEGTRFEFLPVGYTSFPD